MDFTLISLFIALFVIIRGLIDYYKIEKELKETKAELEKLKIKVNTQKNSL